MKDPQDQIDPCVSFQVTMSFLIRTLFVNYMIDQNISTLLLAPNFFHTFDQDSCQIGEIAPKLNIYQAIPDTDML